MTRDTIAGLILAGGQGHRMGGVDKALLPLAGQPLLAHVVRNLQGQAMPIAVSANCDRVRFADFGLPVLPDSAPNLGPLGGILAGLRWAASLPQPPAALLTVAVDTPGFPADLRVRLQEARAASLCDFAMAASGDQLHPVFALWSLTLRDPLADALANGQSRSIRDWARDLRGVTVTWPAEPWDPFFNVNRPSDLTTLNARWSADETSRGGLGLKYWPGSA